MVTKPNMPVPPGPTGLKKAPTKIEPAVPASGFAATNLPTGSDPIYRDTANKDRSKDSNFKLPESVSTKEIKDGSFRYGGGRSAGNRSLAENQNRAKNQP